MKLKQHSVPLLSLVLAGITTLGMALQSSTLQTAPTPAQVPASVQPSPAVAHEDNSDDAEAKLPPTDDPKEIVRRAVEVDHHNFEKVQKYTFTQHEVTKELDKHGNAKSTEIKTYDLNFYFGEFYSRLVQKDDKPLSESDQKKEDEKLDKFLSKRRKESEEDREKRAAKDRKEREEGRATFRDLLNAYDFRIVGEERIDGADTWVIEGTPRKDFKPTQPHADMFKKIKGRIWVEKKDYNWVKVEAEAFDTISFGLFLFRIHPGSRFTLENQHINNELWAIKRLYINGGARIALLKNAAIEQEDTFSNYKKFSTSITILPGVKEVPQEQQPPK
ncbi:MAG TPA: hypothetical protein VIB39_18460 [Candidatus Angelobacter sp.]|jgi:hypothetical protein